MAQTHKAAKPFKPGDGLGARLQQLRNERGITLAAAAEGIGVSVKSLNSYELGKEEPNLKKLRLVAAFYGVQPGELI